MITFLTITSVLAAAYAVLRLAFKDKFSDPDVVAMHVTIATVVAVAALGIGELL